MRESWTQAAFWVDYGARKGWAFDAVWSMVDRKFFGDIPALNGYRCSENRIKLLGVADREAMESFVRKKFEESKQRKLVEYIE
jgi:hypothetical protein